MKARERIFEVGVWRTWVLLVVGGSKNEALARYRKHLGYVYPEDGATAEDREITGSCFTDSVQMPCAIWIRREPRTADDYGTVAHEALHAANHILLRCGVEFTKHEDSDGHSWVNDEPWCYLTSAIVEALIGFARERKPKKK